MTSWLKGILGRGKSTEDVVELECRSCYDPSRDSFAESESPAAAQWDIYAAAHPYSLAPANVTVNPRQTSTPTGVVAPLRAFLDSFLDVHATASRGEAFGDGEGERDRALADARVTLPGVDGHPYHVVMTLVQLLTPAAGMLEAYVDDGAGGDQTPSTSSALAEGSQGGPTRNRNNAPPTHGPLDARRNTDFLDVLRALVVVAKYPANHETLLHHNAPALVSQLLQHVAARYASLFAGAVSRAGAALVDGDRAGEGTSGGEMGATTTSERAAAAHDGRAVLTAMERETAEVMEHTLFFIYAFFAAFLGNDFTSWVRTVDHEAPDGLSGVFDVSGPRDSEAVADVVNEAIPNALQIVAMIVDVTSTFQESCRVCHPSVRSFQTIELGINVVGLFLMHGSAQMKASFGATPGGLRRLTSLIQWPVWLRGALAEPWSNLCHIPYAVRLYELRLQVRVLLAVRVLTDGNAALMERAANEGIGRSIVELLLWSSEVHYGHHVDGSARSSNTSWSSRGRVRTDHAATAGTSPSDDPHSPPQETGGGVGEAALDGPVPSGIHSLIADIIDEAVVRAVCDSPGQGVRAVAYEMRDAPMVGRSHPPPPAVCPTVHVGVMDTLFYTLHDMCLTSFGDGTDIQTYAGEVKEKYNRVALSAIFSVFADAVYSTPEHDRARARVLASIPDLQLAVLRLVVDLVAARPALTADLIELKIYHMLFSQYFYGAPGRSEVAVEAMSLVAALGGGGGDLSGSPGPSDRGSSGSPFRSPTLSSVPSGGVRYAPRLLHYKRCLRNHVCDLVVYTATLGRRKSIDTDCEQILSVLEGALRSDDLELLGDVVRLLTRMLLHNKAYTQASLKRINFVSTLTSLVQDFCLAPFEVQPGDLLEAPAERYLVAFCFTLVDLVNAYFGGSRPMYQSGLLNEDDLSAVLLRLVEAPLYTEMAIHHLAKFLRAAEKLKWANVAALYRGVAGALTASNNGATGAQQLTPAMDLQLRMLDTIREVTNDHPAVHQQRFVQVDVFVKIVNLVHVVVDTPALCDRVWLAAMDTIIALTAYNKEAKVTFARTVGFEQITSMLTYVNGGVPCQTTLDKLFDLLVDGGFDVHRKHVISTIEAIPLIFHELWRCPDEALQLRTIGTFIKLVDRATVNRARCSETDLMVDLIAHIDPRRAHKLTAKVIQLMQVLGTHNLSVPELRALFGILKAAPGKRSDQMIPLLAALQFMSRKDNPDVFFDFDGISSQLRLPPIDSFPDSFSFVTWIRVESFVERGATEASARPELLFVFRDKDGHGMRALFDDTRLAVEVVSKKGVQVSHTLSFEFLEQHWYSVALTCSRSRAPWASTELRLYVNGVLREKAPLKYPDVTAMTHCFFGADDPRPNVEVDVAPFWGQLGAIYLFADNLDARAIEGIHGLGPNYMSTFHESYAVLVREELRPLFGSGLGGSILFSYNCRGSDGTFCLNNTPHPASAALGPAELRGLYRCVTRNVKETIHCLNGIQVLLPCFAQLDLPVDVPSGSSSLMLSSPDPPGSPSAPGAVAAAVDEVLCSQICRLLADMLLGSEANQEAMLQCDGIAVVAYLLEQAHPHHMTQDVLDVFVGLIDAFDDVNADLVEAVYTHIIFSMRLWILARADVIHSLLSFVAAQVAAQPEFFRALVGVQGILDMMRFFFWVEPDRYSYGTRPRVHKATFQAMGARPDGGDLAVFRRQLRQIVLAMLSDTIRRAEVEAIVRFIQSCRDAAQLVDVLQMLAVWLERSQPLPWEPALIANLVACSGLEVLFDVLASEPEEVRVAALRTVGALISAAPDKIGRKFKSDKYGYWAFYALVEPFVSSEGTFLAFLGLLTEELPSEDANRVEAPTEPVFVHTDLFAPFFALLARAEPDTRVAILHEFRAMVDGSPRNCAVFAKQPLAWVWLWRLLSGASMEVVTEVEVDVPPADTLSGDLAGDDRPSTTAATASLDDGLGADRSDDGKDHDAGDGGLSSRLPSAASIDVQAASATSEDEDAGNPPGTRMMRSISVSSMTESDGGRVLHRVVDVLAVVIVWAFEYDAAGWKVMENALNGLALVCGELGPESGVDCSDVMRLVFARVNAQIDFLIHDTASLAPAKIASGRLRLRRRSQDQGAGAGGSSRHDHRKRTSTSPRVADGSAFEFLSPVLLENVIHYTLLMEEFLFYAVPDDRPTIRRDWLSFENGLRMSDGGEWLDFDVAVQFVRLIKFLGIGAFKNVSKLATISHGKAHLRAGGIQRIALRVVLACLRFGQDVSSLTLVVDALHAMLLAAATKDLAGSGAFLVFASLVDNAGRLCDMSGALRDRVIAVLRVLGFKWWDALHGKLLSQAGESVLPDEALAESDAQAADLLAAFASEDWAFVRASVLEQSVAKAERQRLDFFSPISRRRERKLKIVVQAVGREADAEAAAVRKVDGGLTTAINLHGQPEQLRLEAYVHREEERRRQSIRAWRTVVRAVSNARGPWGDVETEIKNDHWMLDKSENSSRMRRKMERNYDFTSHKVASARRDKSSIRRRPDLDLASRAISFSSLASGGESFDWTALGEEIEDEGPGEAGAGAADGDGADTKVIFEAEVEMVTLMTKVAGRLEVTPRHIHFLVDQDLFAAQTDEHTPDILLNLAEDRVWVVDELSQIHKRRYLTRATAIELYFANQTNYFFNFVSVVPAAAGGSGGSGGSGGAGRTAVPGLGAKQRDKAYSKIVGLKPRNLTYKGVHSPQAIFKKSGLVEQWARGEISNFDYLMRLNTIAGRTYNDISQYPVFPWVIADYTSDVLDLDDPATFRDLSKPVGAQTEQSLQSTLARFEEMDETMFPRFHWGTHYSSGGAVLFYMLRVEPFTSLHIQLQGGKFDHADRVFSSVAETWRTCTMAGDVKELIPEFFYFPEMFVNHNNFDLGTTQGGQRIDDVVLPPWAKSADDFVRINRAALESDYVSAHLHEWIDLVFGFKQRGPAAVEAHNLFFFLTYEGAIDIDAIADEDQRRSYEDQIDSFGQTPTQLMSKPHPAREYVREASIFELPRHIKSYALPLLLEPIVSLHVPDPTIYSSYASYMGQPDYLVTISESRVMGKHRWIPRSSSLLSTSGGGSKGSRGNKNPFTYEKDLVMASDRLVGVPFSLGLEPAARCFAVTRDGQHIISCGHWDNSIKSTEIATANVTQTLFRHYDVVTCLALDETGRVLITGSKDATVKVWRITFSGYRYYHIVEKEVHTLYGHEDEVTCVAVSRDHDLAVSGSTDGTVILHTFRSGSYIRTIYHPGGCPVTDLALASSGNLAVYSTADARIHIYTINGSHVVSSPRLPAPIEAMVFSRTGEYLVTGDRRGMLEVRAAHSLESMFRLPIHIRIRDIQVEPSERNVVVALDDGHIVVLSLFDEEVSLNNVVVGTESPELIS